MLIGLRGAEQFIRIVWHINNVDGEYPIGVMLIAPPGVGKSYLLTSFKGENFIIMSDLSGHGLERVLAELKMKTRGYVVLPDLIRAFTRHTSNALFAVLNMCLEEGITRIERADIRFASDTPIRFGFIGAITPTELKKREKDIKSVGLFSRLLPFSFKYTKEDEARIIDYISKNGMPKPEMKIPLELWKPLPVSIPEKLADFVKILGIKLARLKGDSAPFRSTKLVRRLLKGSAMSNKRQSVELIDCIAIYSLLPFIIDEGTDLDYRLLYNIGKRTLLENQTVNKKELVKSATMYKSQTVSERLTWLEAKNLIVSDENGNYRMPLLQEVLEYEQENNQLHTLD